MQWLLAQGAVDEAEEVRETATSAWETFVEALPRVGIALGVLVAFVIGGRLLRPVVHWWLARQRTPSFARVFARLSQAGMTLLGILLAITVVFPSVQPVDVLAGAGLLTVAAGFAFQDVLSNLLAGILLLFRQPFVGGDQIEVDGQSGTVQEINIRETIIKTFDGRKVVLPNSKVYSSAILVQTGYSNVRSAFVVGVAYETDLAKARRVAIDAICTVAGIDDEPEPEALYTELAASTVNLEVRFWSDPHQLQLVRTLDQAIEAVKAAFDDAGIEMPVELVGLQATSSFAAAIHGDRVTRGGSVADAGDDGGARADGVRADGR